MNKKEPLLTIIIPTYQRNILLKKVLLGIGSQTFPKKSMEVIVVDDASIKPVEKDINENDFPFSLSIVRHKKNKGQGAARNTGILKARGKLILFLDDDVVPKKELVEEHFFFHKKYNKHENAVAGMVSWAEEISINPVMYYLENGGPLWDFSLYKNHDCIPSLYTANISLKRSFLLQNGLFDESFHEYGWEDIELGYRLMTKGLFIYLNKNAYGEHHKVMDTTSVINRQYQCGQTVLNFYKKFPETLMHITNLDNILEAKGIAKGSKVAEVIKRIEKFEAQFASDFSKNPRIIPSIWPEYDFLCRYYLNFGLLEKFRENISNFDNMLSFCEKGVRAYKNKVWSDAVESFDKTISLLLTPDFYPAHWHLVSSLYHSGNKTRCKQETKKMIKIFPTAIWPLYTYGSLLEKDDKLSESEQYFSKVIDSIGARINLKDLKAGAFFHLGMINKKLGKRRKAIDYFQNCLVQNPGHRSVENFRGRC